MDTREQKKREEKQAQVLTELLNRPDNQKCADCSIRGPKWASVNIGCFLCIRCAGLHRKMGTHISKVKSTNLDTWSPEWLDLISNMGNEKVNQRLLSRGNVPPVNDKSDSDMEVYIRNKYEKRVYMAEGSYQAPASIVFGSKSQANPEQYSKQLQTLTSMGFTNASLSMQALQNSNGSIERAIEWIVSKPEVKQEPLRQKQNTEPAYQIQLKQLGFSNAEVNEKAYKIANGNMEQTVSLLIDAQTSRRTSQPPTPKISTPLVDLYESTPDHQSSGVKFNNFQNNQVFQQQNHQSIQQQFKEIQPNQIQFRNQMQQQQFFQQQIPASQNNFQFGQSNNIQQDPFQSFKNTTGNINFSQESNTQRNQSFQAQNFAPQMNTGNNFDLLLSQIPINNQQHTEPFQEQSMQFLASQQTITNQSFKPTQMNSQEFLYQQEKIDFEAKKQSNLQKESILSMYKTTNPISIQNQSQAQGFMSSNPFFSQIPHNQSSGMNNFGQINPSNIPRTMPTQFSSFSGQPMMSTNQPQQDFTGDIFKGKATNNFDAQSLQNAKNDPFADLNFFSH